MTEAISKEVLDAAHRRLCRRVAAMMIAAMADADISFEVMDARLGKSKGFSKRFVNLLISGNTDTLRIVSDLCVALEVEPQFSFYRQPQPLPAAPEIKERIE